MASSIALVLAGAAAIVALTLLARWAGLPSAVVLVVAGLVYALLPGPNLVLRPDVILDLVIPPLLYAAAVNSSAIGLRRNLRAVVSLSVGLVLATTLTIGVLVHLVVPAVPLAVAVALGATVAPTDPVASLAIGRRAGLPPRLITLVEGEGLLNDATALTVLQVAVAAAVSGAFSIPEAIGRFVLAVTGGAVSGVAVAAVLAAVRRHVPDPLADNTISLATPFAAYLTARSFGGSGVLAVVIAGLWFAHRGPTIQSGESRLQSRAVWSLVEYMLEGFVFLLIGQQLPNVVRGLHRYPTSSVAAVAGLTLAVVLLVRPAWLIVNELLPARLHTRLDRHRHDEHSHLSGREVAALSWAGTRGVITLAAAFSVPLATDADAEIAGRDLLLFSAYLAVLVTLVIQGTSFALLLRWLRFRDSSASEALMRNEARVAAVHSALDRLDDLAADDPAVRRAAIPLRRSAAARLERYESRVDSLSATEDGLPSDTDPYFVAVRLRREMIAAERDELLQWRDTGRLSDHSLRILQRELDHEEGLLPPA